MRHHGGITRQRRPIYKRRIYIRAALQDNEDIHHFLDVLLAPTVKFFRPPDDLNYK